MGRKQKVYPGQVEDFLKDNHVIPVKEIAKNFDCTEATIRHRLSDLRKEGKQVIPTHKGIILIEKVANEEDAGLVIKSGSWQVSLIVGLSRIASITKRPLLQARKIKALTTEDRKQLKQTILALARVIDVIEVDELFTEETKLIAEKKA